MAEESPLKSSLGKSNQSNSSLTGVIFVPKNHLLKRWGICISGGLILLAAVIASTIFSLNGYTAVNRHGRAVLLNWLVPVILILGVLVPLGVFLIKWAKSHWDDKLVLNNEEIILFKGKKKKNWPWQKIISLDTIITNIEFGGSTVSTKLELILKNSEQGQWIIRNRYKNIEQLILTIRSKLLPHLFTNAIQELSRGEKISFNPRIIATKSGIEIDKQSFPWEEISTPVIRNNKVSLERKNNQDILFRSSCRNFENLDLLLCLIENPPQFPE